MSPVPIGMGLIEMALAYAFLVGINLIAKADFSPHAGFKLPAILGGLGKVKRLVLKLADYAKQIAGKVRHLIGSGGPDGEAQAMLSWIQTLDGHRNMVDV